MGKILLNLGVLGVLLGGAVLLVVSFIPAIIGIIILIMKKKPSN